LVNIAALASALAKTSLMENVCKASRADADEATLKRKTANNKTILIFMVSSPYKKLSISPFPDTYSVFQCLVSYLFMLSKKIDYIKKE